MLTNGNEIIKWVEQLAPKHLAVANDRIGLQLGTLNKPIKHILVALEVTDEVVAEAIAHEVDLIIAHHAIIFRPLEQLRTDTPSGRRLATLIKHDIAVYVTHTNLDVAAGGVNDLLAEALGLQQLSCLDKVYEESLYKLIVFVPKSHQEVVQEAMFHAGAGHIGDYSHCSFNIDGIGTFMPEEGTNPYSGQQGTISREAEVRIETVVPQSLMSEVVQAMITAHPYEEVAYDLFKLHIPGRSFGLGRIGELAGDGVDRSVSLDESVSLVSSGKMDESARLENSGMLDESGDELGRLDKLENSDENREWTLGQLAAHVKATFNVPMLRVVGDAEQKVNKVAIVGGSGSRYVSHALAAGADVLITGDIDYHTAHDALAAGLALIDPGHNIEQILKGPIAAYIQEKLLVTSSTTRVTASQVDTEPFQFM